MTDGSGSRADAVGIPHPSELAQSSAGPLSAREVAQRFRTDRVGPVTST